MTRTTASPRAAEAAPVIAAPPPVVAAPTPEAAPAARTQVDGSLHEPRPTTNDAAAAPPRAWAPPPWLADASQPATPAPSGATVVANAAAAAAPASSTTVVAQQDTDAHAASLQEVALRMERIKASAAAIRQAIEVEAQRAADGPIVPASPAPQPVASVPAHTPAPAPSRAVPAAPALHDDEAFDETDDAGGVVRPLGRGGASVSGSFEARARGPAPSSDLERDFLGDDDEFGDGSTDDLGDGGFDAAAFAPAPRPIPWTPILIAAAALVAVGAWVFRAQLFPSDPTEATPAEVASDVRPGSVAPETKATPRPDPNAGKAVTPEPAPAKAEVAGAPASPAAPAPSTA
ncbi:MAG: hypothetical protein K1X88_23510, partial [Nannocystaceae bacterium]|nr:hypothetical protein [Nannocystaceae bacterium]